MKRFLIIALFLVCCILPVNAYWCNPALADGNPDGCGAPIGTVGAIQYMQNITSILPAAHPDINCVNFKYYTAGSNTGLYSGPAIAVSGGVLQYEYRVENKYGVGGINIFSIEQFNCTTSCTIGCVGGGGGTAYGSLATNPANGWWWNMTSGTYPPPVANFTGSPREGTGPLQVDFIDTSDNATSWNWSIAPGAGWYVEGGSLITEDLSVIFTSDGNYTISHGVANSVGTDVETKTDYIWVYASDAMATTCVIPADAVFGHELQEAQVDIQDIQNSSWTNTTITHGGAAYITTLASHTLNMYATSTGFKDGENLAQATFDGGCIVIQMFPDNYFNTSEGYVTLQVLVTDKDNPIIRIKDAGVSIYSGGAGAAFSLTTNDAGIVSFTVPNKTTYTVNAQALSQGYKGASASVYTGTGSGGDAIVNLEIRLSKNYVTPTPVPTTLPGGGTPYPTADPAGKPGDPGYSNAKGQQMMDLLSLYGPDLVLLCILVTFMGLLGVRFGK